MKKFFSLLLAASTALPIYAVLPGDRPGETPFPLEWIDCSPMPLGIVKPDIHKNIPDVRVIVFMLTRANDTPNTIAMLENLRQQNQGKVLISIITPDDISDAEALRKKFPDMRLRVAVDKERKLTAGYMRDSIMLFPMAFMMDKSGVVLWRGEAVDLPEALESLRSGKLITAQEKKLAPMIYSMQQHMKDGNLFTTLMKAKEILAVDPDNPPALRMAVFASENLRQLQQAWDIVGSAIGKSPDSPRLYFTALDLTIRHRSCRKYLPELIRDFARKPFAPGIRLAFAESLLDNFFFEINAIAGAREIIAGTPMPLTDQYPLMADLLYVRAKLHYALGDVKAAESDLSEALKCFDHGGSRAKFERIEKQLAFFRALLKLRSKEQR